MKCDELKAEPMIINDDYTALYYPKDSVDAAIAELKEVYKDSVDVKVKIWERYKKAEDELRKTQRALWLARAERAVAEQTVDEWSRYKEKHPFGLWREDPFEYWVQAWIYVEKLCRKKAGFYL